MLQDDGQGNWTIEIQDEGGSSKVLLAQPARRLIATHLALLSPKTETRLSTFRFDAHRVNLPASDREQWEQLLAARPPDDDELGVVQDDLNATPIAVRDRIQTEISRGIGTLTALVPDSALYYERLVGKFTGGVSFEEYIRQVAAPFLM